MNTITTAFAAALAVGAAATMAPAAWAERRQIDVPDFSNVDAANGIHVQVEFGAAGPVTVEGPASQISKIIVDVQGDTLSIRPQSFGIFRRLRLSGIVVHVPVEALDGVEAVNGAQVEIQDAPSTADLSLVANNGGRVTAHGACDVVTAQSSRGAQVDAQDLDCREAHADAEMGGSIEIRSREAVVAEARMGGSVVIYGEAESVVSTSSMGGRVNRH